VIQCLKTPLGSQCRCTGSRQRWKASNN
jgi:hypothetical protein